MLSRLLSAARNDAYVGQNRCWPCTAVNLGLTVSGAIATGLIHPLLGGGVGMVGVGATWLRGYVIPGTPQITARVLPAPVLRFLRKAQPSVSVPSTEPLQWLLERDVVTRTDDAFTLTQQYHRARRNSLAELQGTSVDRLAQSAVGDRSITLEDEPSNRTAGGIQATVDETPVSWVSRLALHADAVSVRALHAVHAELRTQSVTSWRRILLVLRGTYAACPACGTSLQTIERPGCCGTDVISAIRCPACNQAILEAFPDN